MQTRDAAPRGGYLRILHIGWVAWLTLGIASSQGQSVEIWPSERRSNDTLYCYGGDWNAMLIVIYAQDYGKHKIDLPKTLSEPMSLSVALPGEIRFLGAHVYGHKPVGVSTDFQTRAIRRDGTDCRQLTIPLVNEVLTQRVIQKPYYYRVHVWYQPPDKLDSRVTYELRYGDGVLASGGSRLLTAGVVKAGRKMPARSKPLPPPTASSSRFPQPTHSEPHSASATLAFAWNRSPAPCTR